MGNLVLIVVGIAAIVWYYIRQQKKHAVQGNRRANITSKYGTEACGVFKLYSGLPLAQGTDCEVAYLNGDIIISAGNFDKRISAGDIVNIRCDAIQEGYTKTSVYGFNALGATLAAASAVGNAAKKANAQKNVLIITCSNEEIAFLLQKLNASSNSNLTTIADFYGKDYDVNQGEYADKIIAAFAADSYKRK